MPKSRNLFALSLALLALLVAFTPGASALGVWNQGVPKPAGVECEDLNEYLFPDGSVPRDLLPVFGADATTSWEESWSGADWAKGPICIRAIADPSCVAQGGCAASEEPASASAPTGRWIIGRTNVSLAPGATTSGGVIAVCGGGVYPTALRAAPPTDISVVYDPVTHIGSLTNTGTTVTRVFDLEAYCA